jgi:hypothetical protein
VYAPLRPERVDQSLFLFRPDGWFGLLAFFLPLLTSLPWLDPGSWANGQAEWVLGATTLGVVRFPGYPLYLLSAKLLASLLPWGAELGRYHFLSLLFGSGACLFLYLIARRLLFPTLVSLAAGLSCFWFYPVWQACLQVGPFAFHLWLLTVCVYATLGLLSLGRHSLSGWRIAAWAALCGATATSSAGLLPWGVSCLLLGLLLGLPRQRAQAWAYGLALASGLAGSLLPYAYLPLRLAAAGPLFVNTDFFTPLAAGLSIQGLMEFWSQLQSQWSVAQTSERFWDFARHLWWRHFPILAWALAVLGLATNLRRLFLKTPLRVTEEINLLGRQLLALLTLMALAGLLFLPRRLSEDVVLGLAVAGPFLCLEALQYTLAVLGQGDHRLGLGVRLKPNWVGASVVLLLPLLTLLQGLPEGKKPGPRTSDFAEVTRSVSALPQSGIVVFPDVDSALLPMLLQARKGLRPDLDLRPLSKPWPELDQRQPWAQWNRALSQRLSAGKPVVVLASPRQPSPGWDYFLQSFQLLPRPEGNFFAAGNPVWAYEVRQLPLAQPGGSVSNAGPFSGGELSGPFRLLAADAPQQTGGLGAVLFVSLRWQFKPSPDVLKTSTPQVGVLKNSTPQVGDRWLVHFWIQPSAPGSAVRTQEQYATSRRTQTQYATSRRPWKATRRLGYWPPPSWAFAPGSLEEQYQLAVPPDLPAGRYQVKLKVAPQPAAHHSHSVLQVTRTSRYFSACEFWVVDTGSTAGPSNRPSVVSGK